MGGSKTGEHEDTESDKVREITLFLPCTWQLSERVEVRDLGGKERVGGCRAESGGGGSSGEED
jgi:hypothetical protein